MTVALVVNGIPDLQLSVADGLDSLRVFLADRETQGCIISPTEEVNFGIRYKIQHPASGHEVVYLTDLPDPNYDEWGVDEDEAA